MDKPIRPALPELLIILSIPLIILATGCPAAIVPGVNPSLTYDGNGNTEGVVPVESRTYAPGARLFVLGNTGALKKINVSGVSYRFTNWNTRPDGSGTDYAAGLSTLTLGTEDVILYAHWIHYSKRDIGPAGGWVFYDKSVYSDGWRYLEAASNDQTVGMTWGGIGTNLTNADSTALGYGISNTIDIYTQLGTDTAYAARLCVELTQGGYSNWFLPSKVELDNIYSELYLENVGGLDNNYYWSSSESSASNAWAQNFFDGAQAARPKSWGYKVRAIRAF